MIENTKEIYKKFLWKGKRKYRNIAVYVCLILGLIFFLFPVVWIFLTSLKPPSQVLSLSPKWFFIFSFENYKKIFINKLILHYFFNSAFIAFSSIAVATIISILAAYGFVRFEFKGQQNILASLLIFYTVPPIVYCIPLYLVFAKFGLLDTYLGLILVFIALTIPFSTWVISSYFKGLPKEIEESAMIDGASRLRILFSVVVPIAAPAIAAAFILTFITTWNVFIYVAILGGVQTKTLPVFITGYITSYEINWGEATAAASIIVLPILALVAIAQKFIVLGLTAGALKK